MATEKPLSTLSPSPSIRAEPDFYAVWSGTMHIGTWSEKDHAEQAVREIEGATIVPLFASPQSPYPGGEGATGKDLLHAILEMPHVIDSREIVLRADVRKVGNATNQLHAILTAALSTGGKA